MNVKHKGHPAMKHQNDDTLGIDVTGFIDDFSRLGQHLTEVDVRNWLEADSQDLGYELFNDDGIVIYL